MSRINKHPFPPVILAIAILVMITVSGGLWQPTHAAPGDFYYIEVDTSIDDNSLDDCTGTAGDCSLRGSISYANATIAGSEIYIFLPADTYYLTAPVGSDDNTNANGDLDKIDRNVILHGEGPTQSIIDGQNAVRVLDNRSGFLSVENLTITHGQAPSGDGGGGGINNRSGSTLFLHDSAVDYNTVLGNSYGDNGGGVASSGELLVLTSNIRYNTACNGGGIASNSAWLTLRISNLFFNSARNEANCGDGGGLVTINGSWLFDVYYASVANNSALRGGGFFYNGSEEGNIRDSTFQENTTYDASTSGGAGLYNYGIMKLKSSTFDSNDASSTYGVGGGIANTGLITLSNVTFNLNTAWRGGGIANLSHSPNSIANIDHVTIAGNTASGQGDTYYAESNSMTNLHNTILIGPVSGDTCYFPSASQLTDLGFNLSFDHSCYLVRVDDLYDVADIVVQPLNSNGGPTRTMALPPGSHAIDTADPFVTQTRDQRGYYRPVGLAPDMGAFEYASFPLTLYNWLPLINK